MLSLGIDVGSSSVKVTIYQQDTRSVLGTSQFPKSSMEMIAHQEGWAEQKPDWWWDAFLNAYAETVKVNSINTKSIKFIGIAYQMHGLVCLDKNYKPLRASIIWCDSRAVAIGQEALNGLGKEYAFNNLLNSPGNFTASKLKWVKDNEPEIYDKIHKICLPGDYIAMKLTGELTTTISGLSEGIFYDFKKEDISKSLLDYFGFSEDIFPETKNSFDHHGKVNGTIVEDLGFSKDTIITYKAGDQPNNALSLNVLQPGDFAANAGTSGVIYGVTDTLFTDETQKVNSFAHVNHSSVAPRIGSLLCINGTGIANTWAHQWTQAKSFEEMNHLAAEISPGSDGLHFFPFGNGAERMLENKSLGSQLKGLEFKIHTPAHLYRAVQESIVYSFVYGMEAFKENKFDLNIMRAGNTNMFLSPLFGGLLSTLSGLEIELYDTDGALGAARGALIGGGIVGLSDAFRNMKKLKVYFPDDKLENEYKDLFQNWKSKLLTYLRDK